MSESEVENEDSGIVRKIVKVSEYLLDSNETANVLIAILIALAILPILGIGVILTSATEPVHQIEIRN